MTEAIQPTHSMWDPSSLTRDQTWALSCESAEFQSLDHQGIPNGAVLTVLFLHCICLCLKLTPPKDVLFIIGDWNAKVGSQETLGVMGKFGLGIRNEAGQRLIEFAKKMHWSQQTPSSNNTREDSTHGHHQMVNTAIRLIIFFAAKDGEALYSQQKQDQELTVAQIMNSLLSNSD